MINSRRTVLAAALALAAGSYAFAAQAQDRLVGSGASFPFPIYTTWFKAFSEETEGVTIDYQSKGSGAGIQDFINRTVDFAASDAGMTDEELAQVKGGAVLLPMTAGEIVLAYNIPGVDAGLKLPRDVYPEIFLGTITEWNDPKIVAANPDLDLPDDAITVVRRSDSSGTTFNFTNHLAAVSEAWANGPGVGKTVQWADASNIVAAPKNDGVTALIKQTPGAIGYIEYGYAKLTGAVTAELENKSGNYIAPGSEAGAAALASAEFPDTSLPDSGDAPDLRVFIPDPSGEDSYPIATFTWMMFYRQQDPAKADALKQMVEYSLTQGQELADQLGYIPLPESVVEKVRAASEQIGVEGA